MRYRLLRKDGTRLWSALWLAISAIFGLFAGFHSYWTDSEIWSVAATQYMFSGRPEYYFGTKPLFHGALFLNHALAGAIGVHPMDLARGWMVLNSIGLLTAVFLILKRLAGLDRALAGTAFLLALSTFIKRGGEVRSDLVAAHLLLWSVWFQIAGYKARNALTILTGLAAMAITPKAIFWILCLAPVYRPPRKLLVTIAAFSVTVLVATWLWPLTFYWIYDPLAFFLRSFRESEVGLAYFDPERFQFLVIAFKENPQLPLGCLFAAVIAFRERKRTAAGGARDLAWAGLLFALLLAVYPDRLPFMIAAVFPFLCLAIFLVAPERSLPSVWRTFIVSAGFLLTLHWSLTTIRTHSSHPQRKFSEWLQGRIEKLPKIEIYDPVGILPEAHANHWFLGPGQIEKNGYILDFIRDLKPEVILFARKLTYLEPQIDKVLEEHYRGDKSGIFVRKLEIKDPGRQVDPAFLRRRLDEEFPRFAAINDWVWIATLTDASGLEINHPLSAAILRKDQPLNLPPYVTKLTVTPFELANPFNMNVLSLFEFDPLF